MWERAGMDQAPDQVQPIEPHLSLWDAVSIIIGIVIGAGIYETAPFILSNVSGPAMGLAVWALGGALSFIGALCYAELATTYPRSGGDYVYLTRAFGPLVGFLFGWAQLSVIRTASTGAMAFVFADYAVRLWDFGRVSAFIYAMLAVAVLTALNVMGVMFGKRTQNVLTAAKVLGLAGILVAGFRWGHAGAITPQPTAAAGPTHFGLAMILVLFTYGGWNDAAFVAAEVRNRRRNMPLALLLGTGAITIIYILINAAYIAGLGFEGARDSKAVAADVLGLPLGELGSKAMCLMVMISALGAVNGLILTGSRVYSTLGADHSVFAWLGRWHPRLKSPLGSLAAQAAITLAMIVVVGSEAGRRAIDRFLVWLGLGAGSWQGHGGFETLVSSTAPVFWLFFLLTGLSLFALREKDRGIERPFSVPLYPLLPLIFCEMCTYMLYSSVDYAKKLSVIGALPLLVGLPLYLVSRRRSAAEQQALSAPAGARPPLG